MQTSSQSGSDHGGDTPQRVNCSQTMHVPHSMHGTQHMPCMRYTHCVKTQNSRSVLSTGVGRTENIVFKSYMLLRSSTERKPNERDQSPDQEAFHTESKR